MDVRTTPEIDDLFSRYEDMVRLSDYRGIAKLYGTKLVAADPLGVTFHNNNIVTRWQFQKAMVALNQQTGLTSMRILQLEETRVSDQYSMVNVSWSATFRKTQSQAFQFNISYLVRRKKNRKMEIVMFIAHEDEKKVLQGYGILP